MTEEQLDLTFAALADSTRRAILARLATGEATVNELAEPFPISVQAVSKHLKVLERAGLITRGREAQWRPCRLEGEALASASAWIDEHRKTWEGRLDHLGKVLDRLQNAAPEPGEPDPAGDSQDATTAGHERPSGEGPPVRPARPGR
jgi:DNA-binding transcriptional ArsR family regulator